MAKRGHAFTKVTLDAASVLGAQVASARRERGWTAAELAERVGVSARTISSLEQGSTSVALGTALEAAAVLGVPLFSVDARELATLARREREVLALLPRRVRHAQTPVDDGF